MFSISSIDLFSVYKLIRWCTCKCNLPMKKNNVQKFLRNVKIVNIFFSYYLLCKFANNTVYQTICFFSFNYFFYYRKLSFVYTKQKWNRLFWIESESESEKWNGIWISDFLDSILLFDRIHVVMPGILSYIY